MDQEEKVGAYFLARLNKSSNIFLLLFSGVRTGAGKFNYIKSFSDSDCNLIFLNCTEDSYYHKGIEGLGGLSETISFIRDYINEKSSNPKVYTFGCSMGGYGAVLYGELLGADMCLAIGATKPTYSEYMNARSDRHEHYSLFEQYELVLSDGGVKKVLFYGDSTLSDILSYNYFSKLPNVNAHIFPQTPHVLVALLTQSMKLQELIALMVSSNYALLPFNTSEKYKNSIWLQQFSDNDQIDGIAKPQNLLSILDSLTLDDLTYSELYVVAVALYKHTLTQQAFQVYIKSLEKQLAYRTLKKLLDFELNSEELLLVYKTVNNGLLKGDLLRLPKSDFDSFYELYSILNTKMMSRYSSFNKGNVTGYVDGIFGSCLKGWNYNNGHHENGVVLNINDSYIDEHESCLYRQDLVTHGYGDGKYAFSFEISFEKLVDCIGKHGIAEGIVTAKSSGDIIPNGMVLFQMPYTLLYLEVIKNDSLSGWVVDYEYKRRKIELDVHVNGSCAIRVIPSISRADLASKGFNRLSGFHVCVQDYLESGINMIEFSDAETGVALSNKIIIVT